MSALLRRVLCLAEYLRGDVTHSHATTAGVVVVVEGGGGCRHINWNTMPIDRVAVVQTELRRTTIRTRTIELKS